jgi:tRNA threonylcarbamoyladenosine dehydratase
VVDAIDTLTPKILLIEQTVKRAIPLVSSMGSGGKSDPSVIFITEFEKSYNCRLAYLLRKKLRKRGVEGGFRVVFSTEQVDRGLLAGAENER